MLTAASHRPPLGAIRRFRPETVHPRRVGPDGLLRERVCPTLDEFLPLVERLPVFVVHRSEGLGDEASDEPRRPGAHAAWAGARGGFDPVAKHSGDVFGIIERVRRDDPWQELFEVVVVRLGLAQGSRQRAERRGRDSLVELLLCESRAPQEVDEPVMLRRCSDRLQLSRELSDRRPGLLLEPRSSGGRRARLPSAGGLRRGPSARSRPPTSGVAWLSSGWSSAT